MNGGTSTRIFKTKEGLSCNIPSNILPTPARKVVEEPYVVPGRRYTSPNWLYASVRLYGSRLALVLSHSPDIYSPAQMIIGHNIDPTKKLQVRIYRTNIWIDAHKWHTTRLLDAYGLYAPERGVTTDVLGRVWISKRRIGDELWDYIKQQEVYPVQIRGTTFPTLRTRKVETWIRTVVIKYLDKGYYATEYTKGAYRWDIPQTIECYNILERALSMGFQPMAEFYSYGDVAYLNFTFPGFAQDMLNEIGRCYRVTSDFKISYIGEKEYKFYLDIRSHYLSICPQTYYIEPNGEPLTIIKALSFTNLRLFQAHPHLAAIRAGFQTGDIIRKKYVKRLDRMMPYKKWRPGPVLQIEPSREDYEGYEAEYVSIGDIEEEAGKLYKLYYALKRVEFNRQHEKPDIYSNHDVERLTLEARRIYVDKNGYVWLR